MTNEQLIVKLSKENFELRHTILSLEKRLGEFEKALEEANVGQKPAPTPAPALEQEPVEKKPRKGNKYGRRGIKVSILSCDGNYVREFRSINEALKKVASTERKKISEAIRTGQLYKNFYWYKADKK